MSLAVSRADGVICWSAGLEIDADGAPNAYGPPGTAALDYLANAGHAGNWYGLVVDADGKPVVQATGFYVSQTALEDPDRPRTNPRRYVDSSTVPYIVIPPELRAQGAKLGDLCWVAYQGIQCGAIVADIGPRGKLGEGSIALAEALGIPSSPKHGGAGSGVMVALFAGSAANPPWPRFVGEFQSKVFPWFCQWGGMDRLRKVLE